MNSFRLLSVLYLITFTCNVFSQKEADWWYFSFNAGIHFTAAGPVAVTNGALQTAEGCATISDPNGNLLFYTNGIRVWNRNHLQMPNGFGLKGDNSSTQSAIIALQPGSTTIYYVFTTDAIGGLDGMNYSIVDMTLVGGLGDVTTKNVQLQTPVAEKLVAVNHCNKTDFWIITHGWNNNAFYAYQLTAAGVNLVPVVSNVGAVHSGASTNSHGQLKCSPDGTKLALGIQTQNRYELFDFNNITGAVTNLVALTNYNTAYGLEFSPDGTKLYIRFSPIGGMNIYQFNLLAGNSAAIIASGIPVGLCNQQGSLQLGPDGKIYVVRPAKDSLGAINNPNILGVGCNYVDNAVSLAGITGYLGLPNFIASYFVPPVTGSSVSTCAGNSVTLTAGGPGSYNYSWIPATGLSATTGLSVTASPSASTSYTVNATSTNGCFMDTAVITVNVMPGPVVNTSSGLTNVSCNGGTNGSATATVTSGTPAYTYMWNSGQTTSAATGLTAGNYTVMVLDSTGCSATQTAIITEPMALAVNMISVNISCNKNDGSATAATTGGTSPYSYAWNNGQTTQTVSGILEGTYTVIITDSNNCTNSMSVTLVEIPCPCSDLTLPNAFSPNEDGENDGFCLQSGVNYCIRDLHITIYDRWGEKVYESDDPRFCWNGMYQRRSINTAVFAYYMKAITTNNVEVIKQGNISLIR